MDTKHSHDNPAVRSLQPPRQKTYRVCASFTWTGCKWMWLLIPSLLKCIKYISKENSTDPYSKVQTRRGVIQTRGVLRCTGWWLFSAASICVAHEDAEKSMEAVCVNGAGWCISSHQEVQCVCCRPDMLNDLGAQCCATWTDAQSQKWCHLAALGCDACKINQTSMWAEVFKSHWRRHFINSLSVSNGDETQKHYFSLLRHLLCFVLLLRNVGCFLMLSIKSDQNTVDRWENISIHLLSRCVGGKKRRVSKSWMEKVAYPQKNDRTEFSNRSVYSIVPSLSHGSVHKGKWEISALTSYALNHTTSNSPKVHHHFNMTIYLQRFPELLPFCTYAGSRVEALQHQGPTANA